MFKLPLNGSRGKTGFSDPRFILTLALSYLFAALFLTLWPFQFQKPQCLNKYLYPAPSWTATQGISFHGVGQYVANHNSSGIELTDVPASMILEFRAEEGGNGRQGRLLSVFNDHGGEELTVEQYKKDLYLKLRVVRNKNSPQGSYRNYKFAVYEQNWNRLELRLSKQSITVLMNQSIHRFAIEDGHSIHVSFGGEIIVGNSIQGGHSWLGAVRQFEVYPPTQVGRINTMSRLSGVDAKLDEQIAPEPIISLWSNNEKRTHNSAWISKSRAVQRGQDYCPLNIRLFSELNWGDPPERDFSLNLIFFIPLVILLRLVGMSAVLSVMLILVISGGIEAVQMFLPQRFASITDVFLNVSGAILASLLPYSWLNRIARINRIN